MDNDPQQPIQHLSAAELEEEIGSAIDQLREETLLVNEKDAVLTREESRYDEHWAAKTQNGNITGGNERERRASEIQVMRGYETKRTNARLAHRAASRWREVAAWRMSALIAIARLRAGYQDDGG